MTPASPAPRSTTTPERPLTETDRLIVGMVDNFLAVANGITLPNGLSPCFRCDGGPALALAATAAVTGDADRRHQAEAIFDQLIAANRQPNGAFGEGEPGPDIDTMFFAAELGTATLLLRPTMDPRHRAAWTAAVAGAADFLIANNNLTWYTNGNIAIGNALVMALAARLTGERLYLRHYESALDFATAPPQDRWPGFGLRVTAPGRQSDGSDGKGYFAETGPLGIGFDPDYSMLQLDMLTRIFLVNGDRRVMRMMNLLINQLLDRVNTQSWELDTAGGTRKPTANRLVPFDTSGLTAVVNLGGRSDLRHHVDGQLAMINRNFQIVASAQGGRTRYALGMISASVLMSQPSNAALR